jgi:hypothetical protein
LLLPARASAAAMSPDVARLIFAVAAITALFAAWQADVLSRQSGELPAKGVHLHPLVLTVVVFFGAAWALPSDQPFRRNGLTAAIMSVQLVWIVYRSNPGSRPVFGSRSRLKRIATLSVATLLGAAAGAAVFIVLWTARERGRLIDFATPGALLGVGAGLAVWEQRTCARWIRQQSMQF